MFCSVSFLYVFLPQKARRRVYCSCSFLFTKKVAYASGICEKCTSVKRKFLEIRINCKIYVALHILLYTNIFSIAIVKNKVLQNSGEFSKFRPKAQKTNSFLVISLNRMYKDGKILSVIGDKKRAD